MTPPKPKQRKKLNIDPKNLRIEFGVFVPDFRHQDIGWILGPKRCKEFQTQANAITCLRFCGLLTPLAANKLRDKLCLRMVASARKIIQVQP